jgi:cyclohexanone monooxygenase
LGTRHIDAVVVGAGFGGIYQLHLLKNELNLEVQLFEKGAGVGGTWYWNRYPGALSDTEARAYRFFFDDELLFTDAWTHRYLTQPQVLGYLERVVQHFDLSENIALNETVESAIWNDDMGVWRVRTSSGTEVTARYLVTALGLLSRVNVPDFAGVSDFRGGVVHTGNWPDGLDLAGKRVGVIGTGSTGTQLSLAASKVAAEVTVFQRRPQYNVPSGNGPIAPSDIEEFRRSFGELREQIWGSDLAYGFVESDIPYADLSPEEREAVLEKAWQHGNAFRFMFETFSDIAEHEDANEAAADFVRRKIAQIVQDPETARMLTPHEPYARRPLCNAGYYEMFNEDHVHLVSLLETPIDRFEGSGIRTVDGALHELDIVVLATGFDAVDGNYLRMDIRGRDGLTIQDAWADGARSYLGTSVHGFPNLFMILGPQSPFCNLPPAIETQARWIASAVSHTEASETAVFEVDEQVQAQWLDVCQELSDHYLFGKTDSWIYGANIPGKLNRVVFYMGGLSEYARAVEREREAGYPGFTSLRGVQLQGQSA